MYGCPRFRVELRRGGHVNLFGLSGCAIPGEHHYTIPEAGFYTLLREFDRARFFSTSRLDPRYGGVDALVKRIGYRDETEIHEVVDGGRPLPAISGLGQTIRKLTKLDYYLTPSVNLYRDLIQSGWNVNTLGQDHENALLPAVYTNHVESVAILLEHGAMVSGRALESAVDSKSIDIFRRLATTKTPDYQSEEGGRLLIAAASSANMPLVRDLLDRGMPVNYRQPQSQETALRRGPGALRISHLLIERGADLNARDWMGRTPLFRAAFGVNTTMIDLLAASGANMNIADNTGRTALDDGLRPLLVLEYQSIPRTSGPIR